MLGDQAGQFGLLLRRLTIIVIVTQKVTHIVLVHVPLIISYHGPKNIPAGQNVVHIMYVCMYDRLNLLLHVWAVCCIRSVTLVGEKGRRVFEGCCQTSQVFCQESCCTLRGGGEIS